MTAIPLTSRLPGGGRLWPGIGASIVVSVIAVIGGWLQSIWLGRPVVEPLVLAIIVGMVVRGFDGMPATREPGVRFVGKVVLALVAGFGIGRAAGLSPRLALLVSCGNAICGNSAIAAVAPVIGADREDVAASIALTAVLGVAVVLMLPLLIIPLGYSHYQYGVLAGLTVYAVPQVLAAAFAVSPLSGQVATVVKLARVLMLGPVVVFLSLRRRRGATSATRATALLPWF